MADGHIQGDETIHFDNSDHRSKELLPNGFKGRKSEEPALWPRSLIPTWTLMLLLGTCLLYCARMAMPICVVTMAASLNWSKTESGLLLGGFFWGYCFTQILGGHASDMMGGERVLLLSAASWSAITAITPLLAQLGPHTLAVMTVARFLMGLLQGVHYPSLASIASQRVVEAERAFLMSTMSSGSYLGTLLMGALGSLLLEWYGWESVFYGSGLLSGLWALTVWQCLLKGQVSTKRMLSRPDFHWNLSKLHWLRHLKQPSVWSMVIAHACHCSSSYTLLSWLPTYFKDTFPHSKGWVYNVIPWLFAIPSVLIGGFVSDFLIKQGYRVASVRKTMQFLSMGGSSVFIQLLCGPITFPSALAYVTATLGLSTFTTSGVYVNVQDLAPSCAGALFGFMNMCGAFMGLLMVFFSGFLVEFTLSWAAVFSLITALNITGFGIYFVFGDAVRVDVEDHARVTHN